MEKTDDLVYKDMYSSSYNEGCLISIQKPNRRMIKYCGYQPALDDDDDEHFIKDNFFLSFPYVVFFIRYVNKKTKEKNQFVPCNLEVAFATCSKPKKLYIPPMHNISIEHEVCIDLPKTKFSNIEDMTKKVIAKFWGTTFNDDTAECICEYEGKDKDISFKKWQEKTKENPKWIPKNNMLVESETYPSLNDLCKIGERLVESGSIILDEDY